MSLNQSFISDFSEYDRWSQSEQGLRCLQFCLHRLDALLYGKATLFKF